MPISREDHNFGSEVSGIDLFQELMKQDEAVKMVLVTGHLLADHMDNPMEQLKAQGLVGWLRKPYNMEQLAQMLAFALGKDGSQSS